MKRSPNREATTALTSLVLPWLLVIGLAAGPLIGPSWRPMLTPMAAAHAQSRIDELKGPKGKSVRSDDIPTGESGWAFRLGSGADTDNLIPATYSQKYDVSASFSAGFGYTCGSFDPFDSVEQMINSAIEKFKQLPQKFVQAAQAAVAGLPAYILNKLNPSLYNVVTKQLDEAFRLFDINFKDCQQIEREIALGQNPYHNLVNAGIGDRMRVELGYGSGTIDDRMRTVRTESAKNGVVMADGKRYGGEGQPPVEPTKNVLHAGYNLLVDRGVGNTGTLGSEAQAKHPITALFKSPEELTTFVSDIYGSQAFTLTKTGPTQSKPGTGYLKKYIETRDNTIEALQKYVRHQMERKEFEDKTKLLIPPAAIDEIRQLPPYEQSIAIDDQARTFALDQLKLKYDYTLQALQTGLQEPNIAQSEAYEVVSREVTKLRYAMLDDIQHMNTAQFLR